MPRILITGASGFVGRALVDCLVAHSGYDLHAVTRGSPKVPLSKQVTWHEGSLLDQQSVGALFAKVKPDVLIQLAWCADHATYWKDPTNFDWLCANLAIARCFVRQGGRRAVFAGTSAEYDWSGQSPLHENETPLKPQQLYGSCKLAAFWAIKSFFEQQGVPWAWARLFNPFGPYEDRRRLIPKVCLRLLAGQKVEFDAALSERDFLHVEDVGCALAALALSEVQGPVNVGSGAATSIRDVVSALARLMQEDTLVSFSDTQGVADAVVADVTRLRAEVGWSPPRSFEERLQETCDWWRLHSSNQ
jgi:nucleoside-diphosphate-sugar epimerase